MGNDNKRKGAGILLFHFPHVRDATSRCSSSCFGSMFLFPACTRDATNPLGVAKLVAHFSFPACTRDATSTCTVISIALFSFPACTRDATPTSQNLRGSRPFSFPACTRDATLTMLLIKVFHFPLVREMQLYGKKATKHAEGQSFLREPRFSRPASRNFPWASSMFGAGSRKQEQQKSRAFSRFPISPEQYDKHQEYTERKHHDTSFRE